MTEGMSDSQFRILREDLAAMRVEFNARFDNLVTRETFRDEVRRTDQRFAETDRRNAEKSASLGSEIASLQAALAAEVNARTTEREDALQAQVAEAKEREKLRRAQMWQWLATAVTLVVGPIVGALIGSAMTLSGLGGP